MCLNPYCVTPFCQGCDAPPRRRRVPKLDRARPGPRPLEIRPTCPEYLTPARPCPLPRERCIEEHLHVPCGCGETHPGGDVACPGAPPGHPAHIRDDQPPTPGPWEVDPVQGEFVMQAGTWVQIARVTRPADARVMAAAPEMRTNLEIVAEQLEAWAPEMDDPGIAEGMRIMAEDYRALLARIDGTPAR